MDKGAAPRSKKVWWIGGGIAALIVVGAAANSSSNSSAPAGVVLPASQTANVAQQVSAPTAPTIPTAPSGLSNDNYYTNSNGQEVHSPAYSNDGVPAGATAECNDGTYSFSQHRSGTCSHHGGVMEWLQ